MAWKGKHEKLKKYLKNTKKHSKINRTDKFGRTALHYAASWADYRMLKILLHVQGIDVNVKDQHHKTPLFKAIDMKSLACVRLLVHAGAKARLTCQDERNALEYAITEYGDEAFDIIDFLYNGRGIRDIDLASSNMSLLHKAVVTKRHVTNVKVINMICKPGLVDVDAVEGNKRYVIIFAFLLIPCFLREFRKVAFGKSTHIFIGSRKDEKGCSFFGNFLPSSCYNFIHYFLGHL